MKVREISSWGMYLKQEWEIHFVNHLSHAVKEEIYLYNDCYTCGYLWHVFSYARKKCLEGEQAKKAFHEELKKNCYIFYQHSDEVLIFEDASLLRASDFLYEMDDMDKGDIYVVDKEFTWTYVQTHETGWYGSYFSRKKW